MKFNPNHAADGKFASGSGAGGRVPLQSRYPKQKTPVNSDGLRVLRDVPNTGSIASSFDEGEYKVMSGIREVDASEFAAINPKKLSYSASEHDRIVALSAAIGKSKKIKPLIVVHDKNEEELGPYVLEGGHRLPALQLLGVKKIPAMVVIVRKRDAALPASEKSLRLKFNPHHDALGRFASGGSGASGGTSVKPMTSGGASGSTAAATDPPASQPAASNADKIAQSLADNEGWEERLVAHEALTKLVMAKVDEALENNDPISDKQLNAVQKSTYRTAFIGVTDNMNNHALAKLQEHLEGVQFYGSAQSVTQRIAGPTRAKEMEQEGKTIMGAWAGNRENPSGTLHLDGGVGGQSHQDAIKHVYAHEIAHAIDWIPASSSKEPIYKLKVSADEAEKTILDRIDKLPLSDRRREVERANVLWNLGEPHSFDALGVKTDDLYHVTGHRELHRPGREISATAKWIDAHSSEINKHTLDSKGEKIFPLSKYATTSASEGFAEFGRLVFTAPRQAKADYPKCWAIWLQHGLVGTPKQQQKASAE